MRFSFEKQNFGSQDTTSEVKKNLRILKNGL